MFRKAGLPVLLLFLCTCYSYTQPLSETEKLASLCKVWGLLKYNHEAAASGRQDWDSVLLHMLRPVSECPDRTALNELYAAWLQQLGIPAGRRQKIKRRDTLSRNMDLGWIHDSHIFTEPVSDMLQQVWQKRYTGPHALLSLHPDVHNAFFGAEKSYDTMSYPSEEFRLLALFRYWNMVQYYFPYRYLIPGNWDHIPEQHIPLFRNAADAAEYQLAIARITASIGDSHAWMYSPAVQARFGTLALPCRLQWLGDSVVVTYLYNPELCRKNDIRIGDVLITVDGELMTERLNALRPYVGASNEWTFKRDASLFGNLGHKERCKAVFIRNTELIVKEIQCYSHEQQKNGYRKPGEGQKLFQVYSDSIAYVHLGMLSYTQVDSVMELCRDKPFIIFDLRAYPQGVLYKLCTHLHAVPTPFASITRPLPGSPAVFYYDGPLYCGSRNKNAYKGRIIMLINEYTQSQAEFTLMALQTVPGALCIGSHTAGADGNVSSLSFPGGYTSSFSGLGVYYPDGRPTQRCGIKPDMYVQPTVKGIREGRDEILERALTYIQKGK